MKSRWSQWNKYPVSFAWSVVQFCFLQPVKSVVSHTFWNMNILLLTLPVYFLFANAESGFLAMVHVLVWVFSPEILLPLTASCKMHLRWWDRCICVFKSVCLPWENLCVLEQPKWQAFVSFFLNEKLVSGQLYIYCIWWKCLNLEW